VYVDLKWKRRTQRSDLIIDESPPKSKLITNYLDRLVERVRQERFIHCN
jgi:hypothetical protein